MLANSPPMLEAHFGVAMTGAVLHTINTRLDPAVIAFQLDHAGTKLLITDREFSDNMKAALELAKVKPAVIDYNDPEFPQTGKPLSSTGLRSLHRQRRSGFRLAMAGRRMGSDLAKLYVGHDGQSEGRRLPSSRRRADVLREHDLNRHDALSRLSLDAADVSLQRLVFPVVGDARRRYARLPSLGARQGHVRCDRRPQGHASSGAPFVMAALLNASEDEKRPISHVVAFNHAAAPPPAAVIAAMTDAGFGLTHLYGLTETYGPATINEWDAAWDDLPAAERSAKRIRQGIRYVALEGLTVMEPESMTEVPADAETLGEVMFRGNIVMKGYLKNPTATEEAFAGGWFHSGDLGVMHPDGYIQIKDRSKDIIISGGENISSIEVEEVLYKHPSVGFCAVVAKPDEKWGETPAHSSS